MLGLLVVFTPYDGHTVTIAERIASALGHADCAVEVCDLARSRPERPIEDYDGVIVGGPLYGGKHSGQLVKFVSKNREPLNERPSAFFSVSLSAAGNEEQQGDATRCLNEFLEQTGWQPNASTIVAGALLYQEYGFFKRWMMKMIVRSSGGDTDTSRNHVYTNWEGVDQFANDFVDQLAARTSGRPELAHPRA